MADFAFHRETRTQGVIIDRVFVAGEEAEFVFGLGTQVFPNLPVAIYGATAVRIVADAEANWFEVGFKIDCAFNGNSAAGFTDPANYFKMELQQSTDLENWNMGRFIPAPVPVVDAGGGFMEYWSRSTQPLWYFNVYADLSLTCNRYGKSITEIRVGNVPVSLPGYPYAMPSQAATLQTHLRTAGYTGAVVSNVSAALSVSAKNHLPGGNKFIGLTLSGSNVTQARDNTGSVITLPGYPYAMPSQRATLQADLRAAGQSGAVVKLFGDEWTIFLPDRFSSTPTDRAFGLFFTPADPYPFWDFFGTYGGLNADHTAAGDHVNVHPAPGSTTTLEANKQFARLKITSGSRYNHLAP